MSIGEPIGLTGNQCEGEGRLRRLHPEGFAQLERTIDAAWGGSDREVLELCRRRMAQLLSRRRDGEPIALTDGGVSLPAAKLAELPSWDSSSEFSDDEKAHLAICEQFVTSVREIGDLDVERLRQTRSESEIYAFASALYVLELSERSILALTRVGEST